MGNAVGDYHYRPVHVKARVGFMNVRGQVWYGKENGILETRQIRKDRRLLKTREDYYKDGGLSSSVS